MPLKLVVGIPIAVYLALMAVDNRLLHDMSSAKTIALTFADLTDEEVRLLAATAEAGLRPA